MSLLAAFILSLCENFHPPMMNFETAATEFDLLAPEKVREDATAWIGTAFRRGEAGDRDENCSWVRV